MLLFLIRLWLGPLPKEEIFPENPPNFFLHWFAHPIKRRLAKYYLWLLQKFFGLKIIALTGSAGKTTTKNLLHAALSAAGSTVSTADNVTSTYNIPSTILSTLPGTKYLILEMGVEYLGDMDFYTWLARPDIAILLNVNRTHTHFLGSVESVAREKSKLFAALPTTGIAIINSDDQLVKRPINIKTLSFGFHSGSFCQIISTGLTKDLTTKVNLIINQQPASLTLKLIGEHLAGNAAAAVTAAYAVGVSPDICTPGLTTVSPPPHRLQPIRLQNGCLIIDDVYNANPLAVTHSLETLVSLTKICKATPVFVFGQMNELGQYEQPAHREIGLLVKKLGIKNFFCFGSATKYSISAAGFGRYFTSKPALITHLKKFLVSRHIALIKASRSFKFEEIVEALKT